MNGAESVNWSYVLYLFFFSKMTFC